MLSFRILFDNSENIKLYFTNYVLTSNFDNSDLCDKIQTTDRHTQILK